MISEQQKAQHQYTWTSAGTDIVKRWKELYGYIPASEQPEYQAKFAYYKALSIRTEIV